MAYDKYRKMILSRAWAWHLKTGWELEELISEGNLVFCRCVQTFNPQKSSFSTYLFRSLQMRFGNLLNCACCKKAHNPAKIISLENISLPSPDDPEQETIFRELIHNLSQDAKEVIQIVFETPAEMLEIARQTSVAKVTRGKIQQYLIGQGWSSNKIRQVFQEIQIALI